MKLFDLDDCFFFFFCVFYPVYILLLGCQAGTPSAISDNTFNMDVDKL